MRSKLQSALLKICKKHRITSNDLAKFKGDLARYDVYPYAPYIPNGWNGILVLGISQHINIKNKGNKVYRESLLDALDDDLIFRLGNQEITGQKSEKFIGVVPWDDGFLKIAMLSCFPEFKSNQYGVSNTIPWELSMDDRQRNIFLEYKAIAFWKEILPILKPKYIICLGDTAKNIFQFTNYFENTDCKLFNLIAVSSLTQVINLFDENDILSRYPEVINAINSNPSLIHRSKMSKRYYIVFAAHAVSKIKTELKPE